ncbi:MAG: hypothetical protein J5755_04695 [Clostridia bacterium]|nr:hypothetical protein [Clostridia bacterium]
MKKLLWIIFIILIVATSTAFVACKADTDKTDPHIVTATEWDAALSFGEESLTVNSALCEDDGEVLVSFSKAWDFAHRQYRYSENGNPLKYLTCVDGQYWGFDPEEITYNASYDWVRSKSDADEFDKLGRNQLTYWLRGKYDRFTYDEQQGLYLYYGVELAPSYPEPTDPLPFLVNDIEVRFDDGKLVSIVVRSQERAQYWTSTYTLGDVLIAVPETYADTHTVTIVSNDPETPIGPLYLSVTDNHPILEIMSDACFYVWDTMRSVSFREITALIEQGYRVEGWYRDGVKIMDPMGNMTITQDVTLEVRFTHI